MSVEQKLQEMIGKYSSGGGTDETDCMIADYMKQSLECLDVAIKKRDEWHRGRMKSGCQVVKGIRLEIKTLVEMFNSEYNFSDPDGSDESTLRVLLSELSDL